VNEFVEQCRSEWRRLGVPDPVANEMAADLAADLEEAEAEGASAQEVLGSGAFDPRAFAAAWAAERGVSRRPLPSEHGVPRRFHTLIGAFALIALIGAVLVILASLSGPGRLALESPVGPPPAGVPQPVRVVAPPPSALYARIVAADRVVAVDVNDSGDDTRTVGLVLLVAGLAGVVPLTMLWLWVGRAERARVRP
jgi:hypothetical protein